MKQFRDIVRPINTELNRLRRTTDAREAARIAGELRDILIPALEEEEPALAQAVRATLRFVLHQRAIAGAQAA